MSNSIRSADHIVMVSLEADGLVKATQTFESGPASIHSVATGVLTTQKELAPKEAEVEMELQLSAKGRAILTKAGSEAHTLVRLWKRSSTD